MNPSVLLVPDKFHWILGAIAKAIVETNPGFEFLFSTRADVRTHPASVAALAEQSDLVHWILDLEFYDSLPPGLRNHPAQLASVHHVLDWERAKKCLTANRIHVVSTEWRDYLVERGADERKITVVPNGIDIDRFTDHLSRAAARRAFGLPETAFVVGFFGSAHPPSRPRKNVDVFIEAMAVLAAKIPELVVFVSGQAWTQDVEMMRARGIKVCSPGFVSSVKLPLAYRALDVFVVTSSVEGGPMTAFEALACGVPLVSTSVGMVKDWLQDGTHMLLIEIGRAEAVIHAVGRVHDDASEAAARTTAGRDLIRTRLKWSDVAPGYGQLYREVLDESSRPRVIARPRRWYERQRQAALQEDLARLMEQETAAGRYSHAAEILIQDGTGLADRVNATGRVVSRRCMHRLRHIVQTVKKLACVA